MTGKRGEPWASREGLGPPTRKDFDLASESLGEATHDVRELLGQFHELHMRVHQMMQHAVTVTLYASLHDIVESEASSEVDSGKQAGDHDLKMKTDLIPDEQFDTPGQSPIGKRGRGDDSDSKNLGLPFDPNIDYVVGSDEPKTSKRRRITVPKRMRPRRKASTIIKACFT